MATDEWYLEAPMWDSPEAEIDSLLVSAQKQDVLFDSKGLTEKYVVSGA